MADRLGHDPRRVRQPPRPDARLRGSPSRARRSATSPTTSPRSSARSTSSTRAWISGYALALDADLLLHDCQYTDAEYPRHFGWGHSSITDALTFARRTRAKRTLLAHHDPDHSDDELDAMLDVARERWRELGGEPDAIELARPS